MCVNEKYNRENSSPLAKKLIIKEKIFILLIKYPYLINVVLRVFMKELNQESRKTSVVFDNCMITLSSDDDTIVIENLKILKYELIKDRFVFNPTLHILEKVFERSIKHFDWSILCNIYKEVLEKEHTRSFKYEITNGHSTVNYAVNDNVISLITAWNGVR